MLLHPIYKRTISCARTIGCIIVLLPTMAHAQLQPIEPKEELEPLRTQPAQPSSSGLFNNRPNFAPGTKLYVNATSLALRNGPERDAQLIHYIQRDEMVTALADGIEHETIKIGDMEGQWLRVQHGQHKGYVFDAYLKQAPTTVIDQLQFTCIPGKSVGPINATTTLEDLKNELGDVNFAMARIPVGEGEVEEGTAVFPGDKQKQVIIQWEIPEVKPKAVIVSGTQWKTQSGIGIGVSLEKLVEINQAPVSFAGFEWDYAGFITSWQGGRLEQTDTLRTKLLAYLAPNQPYLPEDYQAFVGDAEFSSRTPESAKLNLKVSSMTVMIGE